MNETRHSRQFINAIGREDNPSNRQHLQIKFIDQIYTLYYSWYKNTKSTIFLTNLKVIVYTQISI